MMRFLKLAVGCGVLSLSCLFAQVPPPEQLLPDDVTGMVTVPDWSKLTAGYRQSAWGQLWSDPAMKPFRENFTSNFQADFVKPLEKQLGIDLSEYQELLQGQVTLALIPPPADSKQFVNFLLLIDTKEKAEALSTKLADFKKKWTAAGKELKTEKIRDTEFSVLTVSSADIRKLLKKAFPAGDSEEEPEDKTAADESIQLRLGQVKSLFILGETGAGIEKVLARLSGGLVSPLAERASYQQAHSMLFRDSLVNAWLNFKPIYQKILQFAAVEKQDPTPGMPAMKLDKILPALGLGSLEGLAAKVNASAEASSAEFFASVPEAQREGIFKVFSLENKDAAPPAFVPADVLKFKRTRLDLGKSWLTVEAMLAKIDPSIAGLVQLMLSSAGKEQDPNFDLKKNLIANLGDDIVQYSKPPKSLEMADLQTLPTITLIGSPNPAQLLDAIRLLTSLLPPPLSSAPLKEREFLGKKIYSISLAPPAPEASGDEPPGDQPKPAPIPVVSFTASAGYVAFSSDNALLEEFVRSGENPPKPLRASTEFSEAAQKAGGMDRGFFSYENQAEGLRLTLAALKKDPEAFNRMLFFSISGGEEEGQGAFKRLFDVSLLPSFDRIAKYVGIGLVSGGTTPQGYSFKAFTPAPPSLK